jgi:hypothetical protein
VDEARLYLRIVGVERRHVGLESFGVLAIEEESLGKGSSIAATGFGEV